MSEHERIVNFTKMCCLDLAKGIITFHKTQLEETSLLMTRRRVSERLSCIQWQIDTALRSLQIDPGLSTTVDMTEILDHD